MGGRRGDRDSGGRFQSHGKRRKIWCGSWAAGRKKEEGKERREAGKKKKRRRKEEEKLGWV